MPAGFAQLPQSYRKAAAKLSHTYHKDIAELSQSYRKAIAKLSHNYRRAIAKLSQSYRKAILMVTRILTPHPTIHAHTWYDMYLCHKSVLRHTPYSLERGLRLHQPVEGLLVHRIRHNLGLGRLHRIASPKG